MVEGGHIYLFIDVMYPAHPRKRNEEKGKGLRVRGLPPSKKTKYTCKAKQDMFNEAVEFVLARVSPVMSLLIVHTTAYYVLKQREVSLDWEGQILLFYVLFNSQFFVSLLV